MGTGKIANLFFTVYSRHVLDRWAAARGSAYLHATTTPGKAIGSDFYNFYVSNIIFSLLLVLQAVQYSQKNDSRLITFASSGGEDSFRRFEYSIRQKVHIYLEHQSICPLVGIGTPPTALPQASVPRPQPNGRGTYSPAGEGGGVPM
jgi:hypothetical protein